MKLKFRITIITKKLLRAISFNLFVMRRFSSDDMRRAHYAGWLQCVREQELTIGETKLIKRTDYDVWEKKTFA